MGSKLNLSSNPLTLCKLPTRRPRIRLDATAFSSASQSQNDKGPSVVSPPELSAVHFRTLGACRLGIASYPDFEYDAGGGSGVGSASKADLDDGELSVSFDVNTLYIPPLTSWTTKFLGLPLPPFLKIRIEPQLFRGNVNRKSGKIELEFKANFWFSVGTVYEAPPLVVTTVLTSEEAAGKVRGGKGERLGREGECRLVGVATVDPIDDFLMNSFLGLPTECLADLNAVITFSGSS